MESLSRANQPIRLQLLHTAIGAHAQLPTRWTHSGEHETLEFRIILESLPPACHRSWLLWLVEESRWGSEALYNATILMSQEASIQSLLQLDLQSNTKFNTPAPEQFTSELRKDPHVSSNGNYHVQDPARARRIAMQGPLVQPLTPRIMTDKEWWCLNI